MTAFIHTHRESCWIPNHTGPVCGMPLAPIPKPDRKAHAMNTPDDYWPDANVYRMEQRTTTVTVSWTVEQLVSLAIETLLRSGDGLPSIDEVTLVTPVGPKKWSNVDGDFEVHQHPDTGAMSVSTTSERPDRIVTVTFGQTVTRQS